MSNEAPKAPKGKGLARGYPSPMEDGPGEGKCPLPREFFDFESENGDF